jgi:hypothetical protein
MKHIILLMSVAVTAVCQVQTQVDPELMRSAAKGPVYEPLSASQMRAEKVRQMQLQNRQADLAIRMNAVKLREQEAALKEQIKQAATPEAARFQAIEERLDKIESVLARFIDMETDRWKTNSESLDILAKAELERLKAK